MIGKTPMTERMAQINRLLAANATVVEMMAATGLSESSIYVYTGRARRLNGTAAPPKPPKPKPPRLEPDVARAIAEEARRRGKMSAKLLAKVLLTVIARDNLFTAILDE